MADHRPRNQANADGSSTFEKPKEHTLRKKLRAGMGRVAAGIGTVVAFFQTKPPPPPPDPPPVTAPLEPATDVLAGASNRRAVDSPGDVLLTALDMIRQVRQVINDEEVLRAVESVHDALEELGEGVAAGQYLNDRMRPTEELRVEMCKVLVDALKRLDWDIRTQAWESEDRRLMRTQLLNVYRRSACGLAFPIEA